MKKILVVFAIFSLVWVGTSMAMKGGGHGDGGHKGDDAAAVDHSSGSMEDMDHGSTSMDGTFKHTEMAGDVHAEFQVMELADMNMKDPEGNTHHVMVTFTRDGRKLDDVVGKVKLVSPSGKEQLAGLKDFGSGIYAANFTIDEPGKWGVVSLFKDGEGQQSVKFWYPHMEM